MVTEGVIYGLGSIVEGFKNLFARVQGKVESLWKNKQVHSGIAAVGSGLRFLPQNSSLRLFPDGKATVEALFKHRSAYFQCWR